MKVLIVGSGGREHALAWKLFASPRVDGLLFAPGNAGTAFLGRSLAIDPLDLPALAEAATANGIDLTVVGPEASLAAGLVDYFAERGLKTFGPTRAAAQIEASKVWAKDILNRYSIPTGRAEVVASAAQARAQLSRYGFPAVIKADGLAGGKGVWVVHDQDAADEALDVLFEQKLLGPAAERVLVEEHLVGRELSVMAFTDGERLAMMPPARDYKRLLNGDEGPNTGGMGGYTRPADATSDVLEQIERTILAPTLRAMASEGRPFKGVLYAGLMLTADGPKVLEFNCRFGDPEAELVLPLLESDLLEACESVVEGRLDPSSVRWGGGATCGVVLAAEGYPGVPRTGQIIGGLEDLEPGVLAFHGATATQVSSRLFGAGERRTVSGGGRVLTVVATGPSVAAARALAYDNVRSISFEGQIFRTDIGALEPIVQPPFSDVVPGPAWAAGAVVTPWLTPDGASAAVPATLAGSVALVASDESEQRALAPTMDILRTVGIPCATLTMSAFRDPGALEQRVRELARSQVRVVIAVAGQEPALPGLIAGWTGLPVLVVPAGRAGSAEDAMHAASQVPDGVPVAIVSPDSRGPRTAAWMAAAILATGDASLSERIQAARAQTGTGARP